MCAFQVRWPDGFVPEEYGWERAETVGPTPGWHQPTWLRWQIPFRTPAVICQFLYDEETGAVGGLYMGPVNGLFPEAATFGDLHAELVADRSPTGKAH